MSQMFYQTIRAFLVSVTEAERKVHRSDADTTTSHLTADLI